MDSVFHLSVRKSHHARTSITNFRVFFSDMCGCVARCMHDFLFISAGTTEFRKMDFIFVKKFSTLPLSNIHKGAALKVFPFLEFNKCYFGVFSFLFYSIFIFDGNFSFAFQMDLKSNLLNCSLCSALVATFSDLIMKIRNLSNSQIKEQSFYWFGARKKFVKINSNCIFLLPQFISFYQSKYQDSHIFVK